MKSSPQSVERHVNPKKPRNLARINHERVVRWLITDHYSGAFFLWYSLGAEDAKTAIDTLIRAMCKRGDIDIMHGAPLILYTDPGGAYDCSMTRSFLARIGVRFIPHKAGNARATGSVESAQNIVETQFEGRLRMYRISSLDELNEQALQWRCMYNAEKIHSRHGGTRNSLWMTITEEQLRVPESEAALRSLVDSYPESRKVKGSLIFTYAPTGYRSLSYSLRHIPGVRIGDFVGVSVNPFDAPAVNVAIKLPGEEERVYLVHPIEKDRAGFALAAPVIGEEFKAMPDTETDRALKDMDKAAFAAPTLETAERARREKRLPWQNIDIMRDIATASPPTYLPRRGRALVADALTRELEAISAVEAAFRLKQLLRPHAIEWTPAHLAALKAGYPEGVPVESLEGIAEDIIQSAADAGRDAEGPLRLVVGGA